MSPAPTIEALKDRSAMLGRARAFFSEKKIMEVDCCSLVASPALDSHIDAIPAQISDSEEAFLHTSPEYTMKKLLASGSGDIYFLGHVFRKNDLGSLHNPEFMMAEWYRVEMPFSQMIEETCEFLSLFLGPQPIQRISYHEAFLNNGIDIENAGVETLREAAQKEGAGAILWDQETCEHFLLSQKIEPTLGKKNLTVLMDYPPRDAALARVVEKGERKVAERFEIYHEGVELANGYHELKDPLEIRNRFERENQNRQARGQIPYAIDESFITAVGKSFPDCCGVSVGIDRTLMLRRGAKSIHQVLPFAWNPSAGASRIGMTTAG